MARASEQANHSAGTEACLPRTAVAFPGQHPTPPPGLCATSTHRTGQTESGARTDWGLAVPLPWPRVPADAHTHAVCACAHAHLLV
jgi:hypothetical protein